jgi:hypothetical protein
LADPLDDHLRGHVDRARTLVARRLADARTHAALGEIRPAVSRIDELGHGLHRALSDARSQFYRRAFRDRDLAIHDLTLGPDQEEEKVARTAELSGRDQYLDLTVALATASLNLRLAAAVPDLNRAAALAAWEARHRITISRHMETALSDAQMTIHHTTRLALVRKELQ